MRNACRPLWLLLVFSWGISGCAPGKVLHLPGDLSRPATAGPAATPSGDARVAVLDFTWAGSQSTEIGRDYDQVRTIVWKGAPGKSMANLVARLLAEKGISTVRVPGDAEVPPDAVYRVRGRVDQFRVDVRRTGSVQVTAEAHVAVTVYGEGPNTTPGWSSTSTSSYSSSDPLFMAPEGVLQTVNGAANAAAEEAVRRLVEARVVPAPSSGAPGKGAPER